MKQLRFRTTTSVDRDGFTLFETLLALALTVVLLAAVNSAVMLHWKYRTSGQEQAAAALAQLAINEDLQNDFRLATAGRATLELRQGDRIDVRDKHLHQPQFLESTEIRERFLNLQQTQRRYEPLGFVGTVELVVFDLHEKNYRTRLIDENAVAVRTVIWFVNRGHSLRVPRSRNAERIEFKTLDPGSFPSGLVRVELSGISTGNASQRITPQMGSWRLMNDAVTDIRFRFFDDQRFQDEWDSEQQNRLPTAIQVAMLTADQEHSRLFALPQSQVVAGGTQ